MKTLNVSLSRLLYNISLILVFCAPFLLSSCKVHNHTSIESSSAITLSAMLDESSAGASSTSLTASTASRAVALPLAVGTKIGLFLVDADAALAASGNFHNNALMTVVSIADDKTTIAGDPTPLYYPNRNDKVDIYSYYPYTVDANIDDATALDISVDVDQSVLADYVSSDFCWGNTLTDFTSGVTPKVGVAVGFSHKFSQLIFNIDVPGEVVTIGAVNILDVRSEAVIDLSDGAVVVDEAEVQSILAYQLLDDEAFATKSFAVVIPAQTIANNSSFISVIVKNSAGVDKEYIYSAIAEHAFVGGSSYTFNLRVSPSSDASSLELKGTPTVGDWSSVNAAGSLISRPIDNSFTALWSLPHTNYTTIKSATITLSNPSVPTQTPIEYTVTDFVFNASGSSAALARFSFKFSLGVDAPFSYPYQIDAVSFYSSAVHSEATLIQACPALIAARVPRSGAYTLGIEQDNLLIVTTGTVTNWEALSVAGGDLDFSGLVTSNPISLIFCDNKWQKSMDVTSVHLTTAAGVALLKGFTMEGNVFAAKSTAALDFISSTGDAPSNYPFFITKVEYFNTAGACLGVLSGVNIAVSKEGPLTLEIMTDSATPPPPQPPTPTPTPARPTTPDPATVGFEIDGLYWAKGNLVSNGDGYWCKIGSETDYGLYFQWGELVGWAGGANGDGKGVGTPPLAVRVKPVGYTGTTFWTGISIGDYGSDNAATGMGDPCRFYLAGKWRTPTVGEYQSVLDAQTGGAWSTAKTWTWDDKKTAPSASKKSDPKLNFPAAGYRLASTGLFKAGSPSKIGNYWSSTTPAGIEGDRFGFNKDGFTIVQTSDRANAFTVLCVSSK